MDRLYQINIIEDNCLIDKKGYQCLNLGYKNNSKIKLDKNDSELFRECMSNNNILYECYDLGSYLNNIHK